MGRSGSWRPWPTWRTTGKGGPRTSKVEEVSGHRLLASIQLLARNNVSKAHSDFHHYHPESLRRPERGRGRAVSLLSVATMWIAQVQASLRDVVEGHHYAGRSQ